MSEVIDAGMKIVGILICMCTVYVLWYCLKPDKEGKK